MATKKRTIISNADPLKLIDKPTETLLFEDRRDYVQQSEEAGTFKDGKAAMGEEGHQDIHAISNSQVLAGGGLNDYGTEQVNVVGQQMFKLILFFITFHTETKLLLFAAQNVQQTTIIEYRPKSTQQAFQFYLQLRQQPGQQWKLQQDITTNTCKLHNPNKELNEERIIQLQALFRIYRKKYYKQHQILLLDSDENLFSKQQQTNIKNIFMKNEFQVLFTADKIVIINCRSKGVKNKLQLSQKQKRKEGKKDTLQPITNVLLDLARLRGDQQAKKIAVAKMQQILKQLTTDSDNINILYCKKILDNLTTATPIFSLTFPTEKVLVQFLLQMEGNNFLYLVDFNQTVITEPIEKKLPGSQGHNAIFLDDEPLQSLLRIANKQLTKGLFAFKEPWEADLHQKISDSLNNWHVYGHCLQEDLLYFLMLVQYKILRFTNSGLSVFEQTYKGISQLADQLSKFFTKMGFNTSLNTLAPLLSPSTPEYRKKLRENLEIQKEGICENILDFYLQQKQLLREKNLNLIVNCTQSTKTIKVYLSQFFTLNLLEFTISPQLRDLITIIDRLTKYSLTYKKDVRSQGTKDTEEGNGTVTFVSNYMKSIQDQRVLQSRCLGCSPFFIYWMNILDQTVNSTPLRVFSSIQRMKDHQHQIKDQLCTMLNSGGGIILFDCQQHYEKVLVKGHSVTEKQKELYEQRFTSYLQVFEPRVQARKSIKISFVPVYQSPFEQEECNGYSTYASEQGLIKQHQSYRVRSYLKGTYVMRIRVNPITPTSVFYWNQNTNNQIEERYKNYVCSTRVGKTKTTKISVKHIAKQIKRKMLRYYLPESLSPQEHKLMARPYSCFDHECRTPDTGICITQDQENNSNINSQRQVFSFASMVIARKSNLSHIGKAFRNEGIEVRIEVKFQNHKLSSAMHSAIMYHNLRFEQILRVIRNNPHFVFGGKPLLVISITNFLKLENHNEAVPYTLEKFQTLVKWVRSQFKFQTMRLFEFKTGYKREYFVECESNQATLFAYYVLNSYGEKTNFKNPHHLDKMDYKDRAERLVQLCEENGITGQMEVLGGGRGAQEGDNRFNRNQSDIIGGSGEQQMSSISSMQDENDPLQKYEKQAINSQSDKTCTCYQDQDEEMRESRSQDDNVSLSQEPNLLLLNQQ